MRNGLACLPVTHEDAVEIICTRSGVMYDPTVVDAFIEIHRVAEVHAVDGVVPLMPLHRRAAQTANQAVLPEFEGAAPRVHDLMARAVH